MKQYFSISFNPIFRGIVGSMYSYDLPSFFTPNLFVDCVIQTYVDMRGEQRQNEIKRLYLNHIDLVNYLEEFTPNYHKDGSFHLPVGVLESIYEKSKEVSSILNAINFFLITEADNHRLNLRNIVGFNGIGSVYVLQVES